MDKSIMVLKLKPHAEIGMILKIKPEKPVLVRFFFLAVLLNSLSTTVRRLNTSR